MAEIIELERRRQLSKADEEEKLREEKIQILRRIIHCSRCSLKCARCGTHIEEGERANPLETPFPLCSGCQEEYQAYLTQKGGEPCGARYWQNDAWMDVWRTWVRHQRAIDSYRSSREFIRLLQEFERIC